MNKSWKIVIWSEEDDAYHFFYSWEALEKFLEEYSFNRVEVELERQVER